MPEYKYSMVFKYISGAAAAGWKNTPGGWSESVFYSSISAASQASFAELAQARASLLPNYSAITGIRIQQVDPSGPAQTKRVNYAGATTAAFKQDVPQMGLLMSIPAVGVSNIRRHRIAALPDDQVSRGEFSPKDFWDVALQIYLNKLAGWHMRGADLTNLPVEIKTIGADGAYVLMTPLALAPQNVVNVRSVLQTTGKTFSQQCIVESAPTTTTGVLRNWKGGVCTLGKMRKFVPIYPAMVTAGITPDAMDIVMRKIGRPPRRYVGRQRRRRR